MAFFSALPILLLAATLSLVIPTRPQTSQRKPDITKSDPLLEVGQSKSANLPRTVPTNIKLISYNIRWRGGEDLRKLIGLLRDDPKIGGATILGLQEVDRQKKRTKNVNTIKLMADELGLGYAWAAPPTAKAGEEEETGVAILSPYPLSDIQRLVLPHEGPGHRRRVALGATVTIARDRIRFYSVHAETRIPVDRKLEQFKAVLNDLSHYPASMPAIIVGDFNTWEPSAGPKTRKLFDAASFRTPFNDQSTFSRKILFFPLELKLDWIWLRGIESIDNGINQKITLSDHWPLWCVAKLKQD